MPTDCPGRRLTNKEETAILDGRLDYQRREGWINLMAGSGYVMVTTRFRGVAPSGNSFFVDNPPSRGKGRCSVPRSLIHGADDMKLDALDPADGPELTFRLMAWKAEALGFPT